MGYIKVIAENNVTIPMYDEQGNGFFRTVTTDLLQNLIEEHEVQVKKISSLDREHSHRNLFFKLTVEVIEALLSEQVDGIVVILEQAFIKEFAFYISLFTESYDKPIVIYSTSIHSEDPKKTAKGQLSLHRKNIQRTIQTAGEQKYGKSPPLTIVNQSVQSILPDYYLHHLPLTETTSTKQANVSDQPENRRGNNLASDIPRLKYVARQSCVASAKRRESSTSVSEIAQNGLHNRRKHSTLSRISALAKQIYPIPVIPEQVMSMKINAVTSNEKIINYAQAFPGIVLEIDHPNRRLAIDQAVQTLMKNEKPFIITLNNRTLLRAKQRGKNMNFVDLVAQGKFSVSYLHTLDAEILLGVLIAQGKSWQTIKEVIVSTGMHCGVFDR